MKTGKLWMMLTAALTLLASGCGGDTKQGKRETISPDTVTVMCPSYSARALSDYWTEEKPAFDLEVKTYPEEQYYTVLKTQLATGSAADILDIQLSYAGPNGVEELGRAGYLEPLYDVPEGYPEDNPGHLLISEGKVYGKSSIRMMLGLGYNKELFEQYHLDVPACWEDFTDCCRKLKESGVRPLVVGGKDATVLQYGVYQIAANRLYPDHPEYDKELREGEAKFTDPGTWDEVLSEYLSLFEMGFMGDDYLGLKNPEALDIFTSGDSAMIITTSLSYSSVMLPDIEGSFGFMPLPANKRGEPLCISESLIGGFGVYSGSPRKEYLTEKMRDFYDKLTFQDMGRQFLAEEKYQDCPVYPFCNQGWPNEVEVVMENKIREYLAGGMKGDISDITEAMQAELMK